MFKDHNILLTHVLFRYTDKVASEIEAHLDPKSGVDKPWRRNAAIVWLDFAFESAPRISENQPPNEAIVSFWRAMVIMEYLQKYGNTSVAYTDVRPHAEKLNMEERSEFLEVLLSNKLDRKNSKAFEKAKAANKDLSPLNQEVGNLILSLCYNSRHISIYHLTLLPV